MMLIMKIKPEPVFMNFLNEAENMFAYVTIQSYKITNMMM